MFGLKGKILTTLALFAKSITLGCGSNFFPFVIEEMRIKLNTDQETISQIYKIFANASLGGTLGGIIVFRIIRRQLGTMYILVGISVLMIMIPNSPNVDYFIIFVAILGVFVGLIVPGQIVWTMEMWQKRSTPILQALMFCFSVGQALPEHITAPFLMVHPLNDTNVEIVELRLLANDSETIDLLEFKNLTENILPNASNQTQEFSNIHIPFAIVGVMSFFNAWFERILFKDFTYIAPPPPGAKGKPDENNDEANNKDEPENQAANSTNLQNQDPPPDENDEENDGNNSSEDECSESDESDAESDADNDSSPAKESEENDSEPTEDEIETQSIKSSKQFLEKIPMKAVKAPLSKSAVKMREKARTIIIMQKKVIANTKGAKGDANADKGDFRSMKDVVKAAKGEEKAIKGDAKSALGEMKSSVNDTTKSNVGDTKNIINDSKTKWKSAAAKAKNMKAFQKKRKNIEKMGKKLMKMAKDKMDNEKEKNEEIDGENEEMNKTESYETEKKEKGKGREDEKCEKEYEEKENDDDESEPTDDCDVPLLKKENASDAESEISIEFYKDDEPGQDIHSNSPSIPEEERSYSTQDTEITGPFSEEEKENDKTRKEKSISDSEETESTKEDTTSRTTVIEKDKAIEKEKEVDEKCEKNATELQSKESKNTSNENKDEIKDNKSVEDNNTKTPEDDSKNNEEVKDKEEQEEEDEEGLKGKVQGCIKKVKAAKKIVVGIWNMVSSAEGRKAIYVLALSSCVFGAYAAIEKCSKETLSKLAQEGNLKLNEEGGALVLKGFTTAFMWGRFAGMVVALVLSPFTIMCVDLSLIFLGNFTVIFGASFDTWVMLGGCILLGLGLSTLYAGLFTYLCGQIPFTDVIGAILVVGSTVATNFYSEWIEKFIGGDSQKLTSANYISGLVCTIGFKIIYSITKPKQIPHDLEDVVIV